MKPKDLSAKISDLESLLHHFSFEELTMEEATYLKSTFNAFKESMGNNSNGNKEGISNPTKKEIVPALEYLIDCSRLIGTGPLTMEQRVHINGMRQICYILMEKFKSPSLSAETKLSGDTVKELDFNLHHLLHNVLYISNTLNINRNLKIHIEIDRAIPEVLKGDPSLLSHILIRLLGIGIAHMENGFLSLRISLVGEAKYIHSLEFGLTLHHNGDSQNSGGHQKPELPFTSFQKWMEKHHFPSEFLIIPDSGQTIKFILPFQKKRFTDTISEGNHQKPDKFGPVRINQVPSFETGNWDSLLLKCKGDLKILEEHLNLWQGRLLGFIGRAKIQLKNSDFAGLEKSSRETVNFLIGIPFHDICSLLERMARTCATDKDLGHLRFLYKGLLEEYGNMDRAIVSELKRLQRESGL